MGDAATAGWHGGWTAEAYTAFVLRSQMASLWLLACWIAREAASVEGLEPPGRVLDLAAGPGILAHLVSMRIGIAVDAAVQSEAFMAAAYGVRPQLPPGGDVALHPNPDPEGRHLLVYSYGYFHEVVDRARFLEMAQKAVAPGGLLLVVDTVRNAWPSVQAALADSQGLAGDRLSVEATFRASLSFEEARQLARDALPGARIGPVQVDDELLMEAQLSFPEACPEGQALAIEEPTLFAIRWRCPIAPSIPSGASPSSLVRGISTSSIAQSRAPKLERRKR